MSRKRQHTYRCTHCPTRLVTVHVLTHHWCAGCQQVRRFVRIVRPAYSRRAPPLHHPLLQTAVPDRDACGALTSTARPCLASHTDERGVLTTYLIYHCIFFFHGLY